MNDAPGNEFRQILISIIIATFNAGEHLRLCLESITSQEEKDIEIGSRVRDSKLDRRMPDLVGIGRRAGRREDEEGSRLRTRSADVG